MIKKRLVLAIFALALLTTAALAQRNHSRSGAMREDARSDQGAHKMQDKDRDRSPDNDKNKGKHKGETKGKHKAKGHRH